MQALEETHRLPLPPAEVQSAAPPVARPGRVDPPGRRARGRADPPAPGAQPPAEPRARNAGSRRARARPGWPVATGGWLAFRGLVAWMLCVLAIASALTASG